MKKKTLLATVVTLSLLQSNVYAGKIAPGTYEDEFEYVHSPNDWSYTINTPGEYNFKGGLVLERDTTKFSSSTNTAFIGLTGTATDSDKIITITVGNSEVGSNRAKLDLTNIAGSNTLKKNIIHVGGNVDDYSNILNINLKNADMYIDGKYYGAIVVDNIQTNYSTNGRININGDGSSDLIIGGDMTKGVYVHGNGYLNIKGIDDFIIFNDALEKKYNNGNLLLSTMKQYVAIDAYTVNGAEIETKNLIITGDNLNEGEQAFYAGIMTGKESLPDNAKLNIDAKDIIKIDSVAYGIYNSGDGRYSADNIYIKANAIIDDKYWAGPRYIGGEAVHTKGILNLTANNDMFLMGEVDGLNIYGGEYKSTIESEFQDNIGTTYVKAVNGKLNIIGKLENGVYSQMQPFQDGIKTAELRAGSTVNIYGKENGVYYQPGSRNLSIISDNDDVNITSDGNAFDGNNRSYTSVLQSNLRSNVDVKAENGSVNIIGGKNGLLLDNNSIKGESGGKYYNGGYYNTMNINAGKSVNISGGEEIGIQILNKLANDDITMNIPEETDKTAYLNITSKGTVNVNGANAGIMASSVKTSYSNKLNTLENTDYKTNAVINAIDDVVVQGGNYGVIAFENSNVDITSANGNVLIGATDTNTEKASNTAAVYAENGANTQTTVNIKADNGVVNVLSGNKGLWASGKGGTINVDGAVNINANYFADESATRSAGEDVHLAVVAGLKSAGEKQNGEGLVDINLKGDVTSSIYGDIVGARGGKVVITRESGNGALVVNGDVLAGNGGTVILDMGKNGVLTGRIDDYMDAGTEHGDSFFAPQFSDEIVDNGTVNLTIGEGSRWNVDGQSWVTEIDAADNSIIDLTGAQTDRNTTAHALTVGTLKGNANFRMNLDGFDKANSDMLYIKNSNGEYNIILDDAVTSEEIGETGLRFATIDNGNVNFKNVVVYNAGAFDVKYKVGKDAYEGHLENDDYNGTAFGEVKPGTEAVDKFFKGEESTINKLADSESTLTNYKIIDVHSRELNNTGKTIVGMSRANYSNAIYMDRLNKRLGEARYINGEEEQGMWVRIRHDRIGKDNAFRSQNTMYELGYDEKQECDNGERRVGFAVDYMHGDTSYSNISGKGEIDRYGLWLYDTWMGDKGHYADYVAKWGHLKNDFGIYAAGVKDKITGDYSNNVFSISAEYGRKKDIGNDWYIEPQAQLQLARVTGADYVTNQNTKVSVDGINSLIGRAGFRLGKDFGEEKQSTVYLKADVMHEFLGDQDISLKDKTSDGNWSTISYENEGTWYDVGFGFATKMSKNSYAFMDFEKSFGNDNDETYQINVGMQWSF